jgi:diguanylate cyclase (GGDEF)-like protein
MFNERIRVLLIEDNSGAAGRLQELLVEADCCQFELLHVDHLSKALERYKDGAIDLVILDLDSPENCGLDTLIHTQTQIPDVPIIVLTGNKDDELAIKSVQAGAQDYLVKGQVDRNLLIRSMRYAIERHRLLADIEKVRKLEHHLAYHDVLTSLPNRQLFYDRLYHAVAQAKRYRYKVGVLFIDLDRFKPINDSLGHNIGDLLLKQVAQRLQVCIRKSDSVARLASDEFIIVLDHIMQSQDVAKIAQKILKELSKPYFLDGNELNVTASIGISVYPSDARDIDALVKNADTAMYRAKNEGNNSFKFYNVSMDAAVYKRLQLENSLRNAVKNGELILYFQPQVELKTNKIVGVEALLRWQHPQLGLLTPSKFISLAEETGLIVPIGEWVLREGCEQNQAWQRSGLPTMRVSINLSARQFRVARLKETVKRILDETGLSPNHLVLEITESNAMQNVEYTITTLNMLREMGVQISIDDFGTGYASLNYLKRFPLDILKIDRSFVSGLHDFHNDWAITAAVVAMAHRLKLKVLAEGVENAEQLAYLKSLRCDEYQGFYFSQPIPADKLTKLLQSKARLPENLLS